ncbi:MAG: aminoacyl-histidine dipeptidase [Defluviitaleaceae bacterium]|nr:aminoacyl-histidine dipeptidase [Defluviitaleaceae bacterium]
MSKGCLPTVITVMLLAVLALALFASCTKRNPTNDTPNETPSTPIADTTPDTPTTQTDTPTETPTDTPTEPPEEIILTPLPENNVAESAFEHFKELSKIPRASGNMQAISDYLADFAVQQGLEVVQDTALNIFIKKAGTTGRENEPPVILQAHMDMVAQKNQDVEHDFSTDPIIAVMEGDWVTSSKKTTLGADNGVGLSIILAILEATDISHPPIEAVITTDEEVGMTGAAAFDVSLLTGTRFINLDMEEEGVLTVSCAGSADVELSAPVEYMPLPDGFASYAVEVKGLVGGHSGVDIHRGRANANVLMAQALNRIGAEFYLSSIDGGTARNAIPRECTAVIAFNEDDFDTVNSAIKQAEAAFLTIFAEYGEDSMSISLVPQDSGEVMTAESTARVLNTIMQIPNGVIYMSADIAGLVQTSSNLGVITTSADTVSMSIYPRSSVPSELDATLEQMQATAALLGVQMDVGTQTPPWPYKQDSPLRVKMVAVHRAMYGWEPSVEAVHAGLECALFSGKMPNADFISIGPNIEAGHSPDERFSYSSYVRFCEFLVRVLYEL